MDTVAPFDASGRRPDSALTPHIALPVLGFARGVEIRTLPPLARSTLSRSSPLLIPRNGVSAFQLSSFRSSRTCIDDLEFRP